MQNYIFKYYQSITDGSITVSKWVRKVYEIIIKGIESKEYVFDVKKADHAIKWMEKHCFHVEGPLAPGAIKLELWQKAFISCIFGILDKDTKNRKFGEIFLVVARKNGKSMLASMIANYMFQQVGGYGCRIYTIAPKLEQADIIYGNTWAMIQLDPEQSEMRENIKEKRARTHAKVDEEAELIKRRMSDLYLPATNSTIKKIAFSAKRSDGFNPSLAICDEVAAWEGDKGLKQYEVMKSGMGARPDALMLSCTTAGYVNDSIFDELMKRATRFLLGESKEKKLLPFLYMIDDIEKWNDINELRKSNPNMGVSISVDYLLEEIAIAEGSLSRKAEFICKNACIKQNSSLAWLPASVVENATGEHLRLEDFENHYACGGIDLSQTRDLTCALVVIEKNGILNVIAHFWLPAEKIDEATQRDGIPYNLFIERGILSLSGENFIDYHDCENWFKQLIENYHIYPLKTGYDRYSASYLVQDLQQYGMHMDDVYQGENLYGVIQETQGLLEDGKINIGDNDLLKAHLLNSAIKMSTERGRGKLIKLAPSLHIDGCAALLDAMTVRQKWHDVIGEQIKNKGI